MDKSDMNEVNMQQNDFEPRALVVMNGVTVNRTKENQSRNYPMVFDTGAAGSFQSLIMIKGGIVKFRSSLRVYR